MRVRSVGAIESRRPRMSSFAIYIVGAIILIGGLAYGAVLAGVPMQWVGVGAIVLIGIGIVSAVSKTRMKDPPV